MRQKTEVITGSSSSKPVTPNNFRSFSDIFYWTDRLRSRERWVVLNTENSDIFKPVTAFLLMPERLGGYRLCVCSCGDNVIQAASSGISAQREVSGISLQRFPPVLVKYLSKTWMKHWPFTDQICDDTEQRSGRRQLIQIGLERSVIGKMHHN